MEPRELLDALAVADRLKAMTSNNVVGIVDAVKNASDSKPEPKYAVKSESLTSPSTFDKSVAIAIKPAVRSIFCPEVFSFTASHSLFHKAQSHICR